MDGAEAAAAMAERVEMQQQHLEDVASVLQCGYGAAAPLEQVALAAAEFARTDVLHSLMRSFPRMLCLRSSYDGNQPILLSALSSLPDQLPPREYSFVLPFAHNVQGWLSSSQFSISRNRRLVSSEQTLLHSLRSGSCS